MQDEIKAANAEADQSSVDNTNISVSDFANRRIGQMTAGVEAPEEVPPLVEEEADISTDEEQLEDSELETQEETHSEELVDAAESDDVLSQLDLDEMSEEDLRELADKLGSRAVARFGELTAKRKAAEEQLAHLQSKVKSDEDLLSAKKRVDNNPYGNLESVEQLQAKAQEVDDIIQWAEDTLFESDEYAASDIVTEVSGTEWSKTQVRQALLNARKAKKTFLPDQLKKVQSQQQGAALEQDFRSQARKELTWLDGEDNDLKRQFSAIVGDKRFQNLKQAMKREAPEVAAQLDYFFAHATNSIYGRKPVGSKKAPALTPSSTGSPSSARPAKTATKTAKALQQLEARFRETGSPKDFANLRKLKMGQ